VVRGGLGGGSVSEAVSRAKSQALWLAAGQISTRAVQFVATIALARLLLPEHFGKVAIASVVWEVVALFANTGVAATLVQRRERIEELSQAAFWLNATVSASIAALSLAVAAVAARFYGEPAILPIIGLYAASFVISSAGTVHAVLLTRELAFGRITVVETAAATTSAAVSVALAFAGFGYWSLVLHAPAMALLRVVLLWRLHPWRPRLSPMVALWGGIFEYGRWLLGADLVSYVNLNGDYMITGKVLGQHALGIYSMAYRVANWPVEAGVWLVARVAFPTLSGLQADPKRLADVFTKMLRAVALLAFPAVAVLLATAPDLIGALYGAERWGRAAPLVRILLLYVVFRVIGSPASQVLLATGRARMSFLFAGSVTPVLLGAVLYGTGFGMKGVAWATSLVLGAAAVGLTWLSCRVAGVGLRSLLAALAPGCAAGLGTLLGAWILPRALAAVSLLPGLSASGEGAAVRLLVALAAGGAAAGLVVAAAFPADRRMLLSLIGEESPLERIRGLYRGVFSALVARPKRPI